MIQYEIRDIELAPTGHQKIEWVKRHMPLLNSLERDFRRTRPLEGVKISLSIHLEAKTAYLCEVLAAGGAQMSVTGCNVLSTQDDVAAALAEKGLRVFAWHGATEEEYLHHIRRTLENSPNIIIDDGGDLIHMLHTELTHLLPEIWGGCEETTTGVNRLKAMEKEGVLKVPMVAVNDAKCKHLFDNRYGTGQSVWDSIMHNTNLIVAGKRVVVAGYGWCGRGIAMRGAALGARIIITEVDPVRAIEAVMDGYDVMTMTEAMPLGDIFITASGCEGIITGEQMHMCKDGAILANAGHFNVEIDMKWLEENALEKKEMRQNIMGYRLSEDRWINVIAEGRLVNIAASNGHPAEIMDMSFAVQAFSVMYVLQYKGGLQNKVYDVAGEIDATVAARKLSSWGIKIDTLSSEQEKYLKSWSI